VQYDAIKLLGQGNCLQRVSNKHDGLQRDMRHLRVRRKRGDDADHLVQGLHRRERDRPAPRPHHGPLLPEQLDHRRPLEAVKEQTGPQRNSHATEIEWRPDRAEGLVDNAATTCGRIGSKGK